MTKVGAKETVFLRGEIGECGQLTSVGRGSAGSWSLCAAEKAFLIRKKIKESDLKALSKRLY